MAQEYVLRERDDEEINRLKFQHQVWEVETNLALEKADVNPDDRILDLGSGPGYLSYDLLKLVGSQGEIFCLDNSEKFIEFIESQGIKNIHPIQTDIRNELGSHFKSKEQLDKIFCRWVLIFSGNVEQILKESYQILKPGGKFISMEYFNFRQMGLFPKSEIFDHVFSKVWEHLKGGGGDPDIGGKLYQTMKSVGFRKVEVFPLYKTGKLHSSTWKWMEQINRNHNDLVSAKLITEKELAEYHVDWAKKSEDENAFVTAPPLMITVGTK